MSSATKTKLKLYYVHSYHQLRSAPNYYVYARTSGDAINYIRQLIGFVYQDSLCVTEINPLIINYQKSTKCDAIIAAKL